MLLSLIKKDLLLTWKYILLMAALCCFYPLFILHNLKGEAAAYAGSLSFSVMTLFAVLFSLLQAFQKEAMYPKAAAWLCALPYSRRDLVLSKYLYFLGVHLLCCMIYGAETLLVPSLGAFGPAQIIPVFAGAALLFGIYLPFQYRLGYEFTKYFFLFAILIVSFLLPMLFRRLPQKLPAFRMSPGALSILLVLSAALLAASAALSVHFYKKRALL